MTGLVNKISHLVNKCESGQEVPAVGVQEVALEEVLVEQPTVALVPRQVSAI